MAALGPDIAPAVIAACQAGAAETAEAIGRTFDKTVTVKVGEATTYNPESPPSGFDGPGLIVVLIVDDVAALAVIPESSGLLPEWYVQPDATAKSKLTTLAQELGMLVLPDEFMPADFRASRVGRITDALVRGGVASGAGLAPLELEVDSASCGALSVLWPASTPAEVFAESAPAAEAAPTEAPPSAPPSAPPAPAKPIIVAKAGAPPPMPASYESLPNYARSLLKIKVPVTVKLASKKQPIGRILELGPGSIVQFDKLCEDMLDLEVNGHLVAAGEAVKVGDKFGIRLTSLTMPEERFKTVLSARAAAGKAAAS